LKTVALLRRWCHDHQYAQLTASNQMQTAIHGTTLDILFEEAIEPPIKS
jgi:hypothetical protein